MLVSDTVGFVKNLPHGLVASFKSTLDDALDAFLLLHVIDASDPGFERQLEVTDEVLEEIGANVVPASASSTASSSARCDKFRTFDPNTPILYTRCESRLKSGMKGNK